MRQVLFFIPHQLFGVNVFGFGWLLAAWLVFGVALMVWLVRRQGWNADTIGYLPFLVIVGLVIAFGLPILEARGPNGQVLGLPIRGYGTFVLAGFAAGVWLALRRSRLLGISSETVFALAFWLFLAGIAGGRLFFVIEYWDEFRRATWRETLIEVLRFTEGGLVVYGALLAGLVGMALFCWRHKFSALEIGDMVAPSLVLGAALGRLGCLMNGCCYGGICESGPFCIEFPRFNSVAQRSISPPYQYQLTTGRLHGFVLGTDAATDEPMVQTVRQETLAAQSGLKEGDRIIAINGAGTPDVVAAHKVLEKSGPSISIATKRGWTARWTIGSMPPRSLPVHPVQIYSSIDALLLCLLLITSEPYFGRRGAVLALLLSSYPFVRIVEEMIRVDEPTQFGTGMTISQLVSVGALVAAAVLWVIVYRQAPRS